MANEQSSTRKQRAIAEAERRTAKGQPYCEIRNLIDERDDRSDERDALHFALTCLTYIGRTDDGHIIIGPRGWEIAQKALGAAVS